MLGLLYVLVGSEGAGVEVVGEGGGGGVCIVAANSLLLWPSHAFFLSHKIRLSTSRTVAFSKLSS